MIFVTPKSSLFKNIIPESFNKVIITILMSVIIKPFTVKKSVKLALSVYIRLTYFVRG